MYPVVEPHEVIRGAVDAGVVVERLRSDGLPSRTRKPVACNTCSRVVVLFTREAQEDRLAYHALPELFVLCISNHRNQAHNIANIAKVTAVGNRNGSDGSMNAIHAGSGATISWKPQPSSS